MQKLQSGPEQSDRPDDANAGRTEAAANDRALSAAELKKHAIVQGGVRPVIYLLMGVLLVRLDSVPYLTPESWFRYVIIGAIGLLGLLLPIGVFALLRPDSFLRSRGVAVSRGALLRYAVITLRIPGTVQDISACLFLLTGNLLLLGSLIGLSMPMVYLVHLHNKGTFGRYAPRQAG